MKPCSFCYWGQQCAGDSDALCPDYTPLSDEEIDQDNEDAYKHELDARHYGYLLHCTALILEENKYDEHGPKYIHSIC